MRALVALALAMVVGGCAARVVAQSDDTVIVQAGNGREQELLDLAQHLCRANNRRAVLVDQRAFGDFAQRMTFRCDAPVVVPPQS